MPLKPQNIKLLIFDMDGVLYNLDLKKRLAQMAKVTGKEEDEINQKIWHSSFELKAEQGFYKTGTDYLDEFNALLGTDLTKDRWFEIRSSAMAPIPEMLDLCYRLKEHHTLALLTNNGMLVEEGIKQQKLSPELKDIFGINIFASAELQARKPDVEVYLNLCHKLGVPPQHALMIDDKPENITGALKAGLQGHHYQNTEALMAKLHSFNIAC